MSRFNTAERIGLYLLSASFGALIGKIIAEEIVIRIEEKEARKLAKDIVQNAIESEKDNEYWDGTKKEEEKPDWKKEDDVNKLEETRDELKKGDPKDYTLYTKRSRQFEKTVTPSDIVKDYLPEEDEPESEETDISEENEVPEKVEGDGPRIISLGEYADSNKHFNKVTLTYYDKDDVLVNMDDEVLYNPERILGEDALVSFGKNSGDADSVYVRNPKLKTDYEIARLHRSYSKEILGIDPLPAKKKSTRPKTRKVKAMEDDDGEDE